VHAQEHDHPCVDASLRGVVSSAEPAELVAAHFRTGTAMSAACRGPF
jgi:hypothetical protein